MLTETEKAYIAGIVDGEGCISITSRNKYYLYPYIKISVTDKCLIDYLQKVTGCGCCTPKISKNKNHKKLWTWLVTYSKCTNILNQIRPYLIIKKRQANIVCSWDSIYQNSLKERGIKKYGNPFPMPDILHDLKKQCKMVLHKLNRRGTGGNYAHR